jgi:hypothetical protein
MSLQQALLEATARNTCRWTTNSRTLVNSMARDERSLFGIRALEAGYNGGIVQARQVPRQSSMMRSQRLSQQRLSRSLGLYSRPRVLSPTIGSRLQRSSVNLVDVGELQNLQSINAREESSIPPRQDQLTYSSYDDREPLLAMSGQQPHLSSIPPFSQPDLEKPLPRPPGLLRGSQATTHLSVSRLPSLKFEHRRRHLSLPLSLSSQSRASNQSWQPISDAAHDLDGAVEYGNRYSGVDHIPSTTPSPKLHRRMSSAPISMHNSARTSTTSNAFSAQFSDGILSFHGYTTPEQTTWDGMSLGRFGSPMRMVPPPLPWPKVPIRYTARSPPASPTPYVTSPQNIRLSRV